MDVFDLQGKITLDIKDYLSGIKTAEDKSESFASKIGKGFKTISKVGAVALSTASTAVTAFGASSVRAGMDFDTSMSQVQATMGKTAGEMQDEVGEVDLAWGHFSGNLREYAQEMGEHTAFSATQSAEALNYMALAGYNTEESMKMLPTVLNLASAGNMDLATASDMVTDAQTALGLSMDETATMVDQMAKTASTTNTSVSQLGSAFLTIGGTAKDMKGGTQELSQVLGLLADNGIKASEGGTHLRNMMLKLVSPTKDGKALLESFSQTLGHDLVFDEKTGEMRAFSDIFQDLNTVMGDFSDKQRMQTFSELFNTRDLKAANALLGTSKERWEEVDNAIADAKGSAQEMANTQLDNLEGDITLFKSALEGAQIAVSDGLSPTLREFVQFGTDGISKLTGAFKEGGITGAMEEFGSIIAEGTTKVVEGLPKMIDAGAKLLKAFVSGIMDSLPMIVDSAIQIVENLANLLVENAPKMLEGATKIITTLGEGLAKALPKLLPKVAEIITGIVQGLIDNLPQIVQVALDIIVGLADGLVKAIPELVKAIPDIIKGLVDAMLQNIPMIIQAGIDLLTSLVDGLPEIINTLIEAIPDIILGIVDAIINNIPMIIEAGFKLFTALITNLPKIIVTIVQAIPKIGMKLVEAVLKLVPKIAQAGFTVLTSLFKNIASFLKDIPKTFNKIWEGIKSAVSKFSLVETGKNLIKGLWNGIVSVKDWVVDKIKGLGNTIIDAAKSVFGIHSPSTVFRDVIGKNIGKGLAQGIKESKKEAVQEVEQMYSDMLSYATKALSNYKVYHQMSLKDEADYWNAIRKQMKKGTQARIDADAKYFSAKEALKTAKKEAKAQARELTNTYLREYNELVEKKNTKITQIREKLAEDIKKVDEGLIEDLASIDDELAKNIKSVNDELADNIEKLTNEYNKSVQSRYENIMGMTDLFSRTSFDTTYSKEYLQEALQDQVDALESWDNELDVLENKLGRDNPLFEYLQDMGVSSLYTLQEINNMSEDELKAYSDLYAKKSKVANDRAVQENKQLLDDTNKQIELLRSQAESQIDEYTRQAENNRTAVIAQAQKDRVALQAEADAEIQTLVAETDKALAELTATFKKDMKELAEQVKEQGKDVGKQMAEGIAKGVKDSAEIIQAAARKAAQEALAAARAALGIKSPSKEFAKIGKFVDEGFAKGIADNAYKVQNELNKVVDIPSMTDVSRFATTDNNNGGGNIIQNLTVNSPQALQPSEVARQTRLANQQMVLALRGV